MRIRRLQLRPYGAFGDLTLAFRAPEPGAKGGLHLVYGTNGAGKTTSLEALRAVLFGMTPGQRAFRVPSGELRLGAELEHSSGERLEYWRRTSSKAPLWDASDESPLETERLAPFLGGLDAARYETLFGLDLETLVEGGQELLRGEGEIGRALFGAGLGGRRLAAVEKGLAEATQALFAERAPGSRLRLLQKEHKELRSTLRSAQRSQNALQTERRRLKRLRAELDATEERRRAARREAESLRGLADALGALRPLQALQRERAARGDEVALDAGSTEQVLDSASERERLRAALEDRVRTAARLEGELAACQRAADQALLQAGPEIAGLAAQVEATAELAARLARERLELESVRGRREDGLRSMPDGAVAPASAEADEAETEALQRLAEALGAAERERSAAAEACEAREAERRGALRALEELPARIEEDLAGDLRALDPPVDTLARLARLVPPGAEARARHAAAHVALEREREALEGSRHELDEELRTLEDQRARQLAAEVEPPVTREVLRAARDERDAALRAVLQGVAGGDVPGPERLLDLERRVLDADGLADRLQREADRAARWAEAEARRARLVERRGELEAESVALAARVEAEQQDWARAWSRTAAGVEAKSEATAEVGDFLQASPAVLSVWVERRDVLLERRDRARTEAVQTLERAEEALEEARAGLRVADDTLLRARSAWEAWARERKLDPAAGPEPARRRLLRHAELRATERDRERLEASITAAEGRLGEYEAAVAALGARLAAGVPAPAEGMAQGAATAGLQDAHRKVADLSEALDAARQAQRDAERLRREVEDARAARVADQGRLAALDEGLAELVRGLELESLNALLARARRSQELRGLDERIEDARQRFAAAAGGGSAEALLAEVGERDVDALRAGAEAADERVEVEVARLGDLREELAPLVRSVDGPGADEAAELGARLAQLEAEMVELGEQYLELRLARLLLDREVDRYRQETQGPLLARAQTLFEVLTRGAYVKLHPSTGERGREVMVARRPDGSTVGVTGMSTGTRDQLYLALRVASVEHLLRTVEPLPFLADDLFVNFDDDRTEAALRVLAELGRSTQVIVFTHHLSVVDTATRLTDEGIPVDVVRLASEAVREGHTAGGA